MVCSVIYLACVLVFFSQLELLHIHDIIIRSEFLVHELLQEASVDCFPSFQ